MIQVIWLNYTDKILSSENNILINEQTIFFDFSYIKVGMDACNI